MVSGAQLLAFSLTCLIVIAIPGPSVLFVVGRALAHGRRTALASVLGNVTGVQVVAVSVALGVGALVQRSALAFTVVKLAGAAYLVWLGVQAVRHRRSLGAALEAGPGRAGGWRAVAQGFTVGVANPKAYVLFAAVLPQFADRAAGHVPLQLIILSLVSLPIGLICDSAWGLAASAVRSWFATSPKRLELVGGLGGLAMIGLGLSLALTGRKD
ncbi:MAG: LysE family translocator [Actinobacteria bacterium]|nr:LysE family translocator [Actinomycetota bacterium]MBO0817999.1 LysE family translocator [Actinomycetota bacterium]